MAILGSTGKGIWQFSRDGGKSWQDLGWVESSQARLLSPADRVRFVPLKGFTGTATLSYRAWDMTVGTAGAVFDVKSWTKAGVQGPFSQQVMTTSLLVEPVRAVATHQWTLQETASLGVGQVAAVVAVEGQGSWQYSTDGKVWRDVGYVRENRALVLGAEVRLRFVARAGWSGRARLTFRVKQMGYRTGVLLDLSKEPGEFLTVEWPTS
jgi:hypothetical protein